MWTANYFVRFVRLPYTIPGVIVPNDDGTFDIYLNDCIPENQREKAIQHELEHIARDHFYQERPIAEIEEEANGEKSAPKPGYRFIRCYRSLDAFKAAMEREKQLPPKGGNCTQEELQKWWSARHGG